MIAAASTTKRRASMLLREARLLAMRRILEREFDQRRVLTAGLDTLAIVLRTYPFIEEAAAIWAPEYTAAEKAEIVEGFEQCLAELAAVTT
jgi:hypothetical protein